MKIFFYLFVLLFLFHQRSYAQKQNQERIDSLLTVFAAAKEDTTKISLLCNIMYTYVYFKPQEGLTYEKQALALAQKANWPIGVAKVKDKTGRLNWRLGNYSEALKNHFEAYGLFEKAKDKYKNYVLVEIAQDYLDDGKHAQAESYLLKALKLSTAAGDTKTMMNTYDVLLFLYNIQGNTIERTKVMYAYMRLAEKFKDKKTIIHLAYASTVYFLSLGYNEQGLKFFKQALQTAKELGNKIAEIHFTSLIGNYYSNTGNYPEAMNYYSAALTLANKLGDAKILGKVIQDLGNFNQLQQNYTAAINNYVAALKTHKTINYKEGLAISYYKMGITYTSIKKYDEARTAFDNSRILYKKLNTQLLSMGDYYGGREMLEAATGNWKGAYEHYKQFVIIRDSAFNQEALKKLVTSQMQFEADKKEAAAKATQEKKDLLTNVEIKRQRNILYSAFTVLLIVLVFSVVVFRQRNKIAKEKKRSDLLLMDKELLLKEIHHRVKNNLEVVSSLLALQSAQIDDPHTKEAMQEGQNRVHSIGIVHQKLYQGTNLGAIEMKDYFINLSDSILDSFGAEKRVTIECAMELLDVDIDTAVPLGLIVNELLTNTLKYAFPGGQHGNVQIKLRKQADGILQLQVSDNGVGKSGIIKGTGFGGQLIALLTQQLGGSMREEVKNGTHIYFEFKTGKAA